MSFIKSLFRKATICNHTESTELHRCLNAFDLTLLGIGAIIGAGIFVLTGIAAATKAGPAIVLSYALAGLACGFSALSYAELSSSIGGCGSAYGYAYAGLGEIIAWIIGWDLIMEYGLACSTVAIGWSGYVTDGLKSVGIIIPPALTHSPFTGGIMNLPAIIVVLTITLLLIIGVRKSTRFNSIIVLIKLIAIVLFIGVGAFNFKASNWQPFLPFGWHGVVTGAALIFFAYIGFDAVSTAAEEAITPQRDLPIGIISSLIICTIIYMIVAGLLTGAAHYSTLNVSSPVAHVLLELGYNVVAGAVAVGAIAGLTTVILVMYYGLTRILLAMSRDGLLPKSLSRVNPMTRTPIRIIAIAGIIIAIVAGFLPIQRLAELVNIGTLAAFALVSLGVMLLRYTQPNLPRPFKTPLSPIIPTLGVIFCCYLMISLPKITWINFGVWTVIGLIIYFLYGRSRSVLSTSMK